MEVLRMAYLDEATSASDNKTEKAVKESIDFSQR